MNLQELSKRAHENAVNHGFWREKHSNEHCLMLICTEVAELAGALFAPVFDKAEKENTELAKLSAATIMDFAIIHFTKQMY